MSASKDSGLLRTFGDSGSLKQNCHELGEGGKLKILVNQWRNEQSFCYQLGHHLAFTKSDTAGEVSFAGISTLTNPVFGLVLNVNHASCKTSPAVSKVRKSQHCLHQWGIKPPHSLTI
jgi:hypothetical protein